MIPQPFEYHVPKTVAEASQLLAEFGDEGKVLAGGHSLIPLMKFRLAAPEHIIDIGRIGGLSYIREEGDKIQIGALTTHYQIESSELLKAKCPLLPQTAVEIGDPQVRNKGTLGGALAHSDPAADWPATILALDAEIHAESTRGDRWIRAQDFFLDMLATALEPDEILTAVKVPVLPAGGGDAYTKLHQPASGFAVVGVAARVVLNASGEIAEVSVGVTGVGSKAYRASGVEETLRGRPAATKLIAEAASHAADGVDANSDLFASAEYRRHLASVYTQRAIEKAVERAGKK
ncbi:MAG TPA: xanthine dehydrogenase family protein subunit M [Terriglobia bacterium]|nr:xanthine dehydrogenase family protein subunit M [Terriglobia bacterium]